MKVMDLVLGILRDLERGIINSARLADTVAAISSRPPIEAIPALAMIAFTKDRAAAAAAARSLESMLDKLPSLDFPRADSAIRQEWATLSYQSQVPWKPAPHTWPAFEAKGHGALAVLACHPNGHVREEAVRRLARNVNRAATAILLVRVNDWVPQVRSLATAAIGHRATAANASLFLPVLPLALRLRTCSNGLHSALIDRIEEAVQAPDAVNARMGALNSPHDIATYHAIVELSLDAAPADTSLIRHALRSRDPHIRSRAAKHLEFHPALLDDDDLAESLLRDRLMPVRRTTLHAYIVTRPYDAVRPLTAALLDRSAIIREMARTRLLEADPQDFAAFYRNALNHEASGIRRAAVAGLGETGNPEDAAILAAQARSAPPGVRRQSVASIARLAGAQFVDFYLETLADEHSGVSREACIALSRFARQCALSKLRGLTRHGDPPHIARNAVRVLSAVGKWPALTQLLDAAASGSAAARDEALHQLSVWLSGYNRVQVPPSPLELDLAAESLEFASVEVNPDTTRKLEDILKYWRRHLSR